MTFRPLFRSAWAAALLVAALGCSGQGGAAQDSSVVPTDISTITQRADQGRVKGDEAAPLRMVEVSDFQCPFCERYFRESYPTLDSLYIETGKLRYVWVSFPNPRHEHAWPAIEAAFCAGAVGKFWQMHDLLFERQSDWSESKTPVKKFEGYAVGLGIDSTSFRACVEEDRPAPLQVRDFQSTMRAGIDATPFFIVNDSVSVRGAAPLERFRTLLDSLLAVREARGKAGG